MIDKPGIYRISMEEYLSDPCPDPSLSSGILHTVLMDTPAMAMEQHVRLNPNYQEKPKAIFDMGSASHSMVLEGIDCCRVIDAKDWRTKSAQEARDTARLEGKIPLLPDQYEQICGMATVAEAELYNSELAIADLRSEGDSELTIIWNEDDVWHRIRPDWMSKDRTITLNYKTTGNSPNPNSFAKTVVSLGYDIADSYYRRGIKFVTGVSTVHIFMVQSVEPPYLCSFIGLSPEFQAMGDSKVQQGIDVWKYCLSSGNWPGYPSKIMWIDPPAWSLMWQESATFIPDEEV